MTMPTRGDNFASMAADVIKVLVLLLFSGGGLACNYPDEGNMPVRRAVSKVKFLEETQAWASRMQETGAVVQYALLLDQPRTVKGRCYWPVEVRAEGKLWRRFYITPDGKDLLKE